MPSSFLEMALPVLRTEDSFIIDWVHELLQVLEHRVKIKLGLLLAISVSLVYSILQVLLNGTRQAGVRFIDCSLYMHEPGESSLYVPRQDSCIV